MGKSGKIIKAARQRAGQAKKANFSKAPGASIAQNREKTYYRHVPGNASAYYIMQS
mgnify:CR=1 FL=1